MTYTTNRACQQTFEVLQHEEGVFDILCDRITRWKGPSQRQWLQQREFDSTSARGPVWLAKMGHDLLSPTKGRKLHGPSPSMVRVPKLDLPLPLASPRRRGSTAAIDEMDSFMPLTPAPTTPGISSNPDARLRDSRADMRCLPALSPSSQPVIQTQPQESAATAAISDDLPCSELAQLSPEDSVDSQQAPLTGSATGRQAEIETFPGHEGNQPANLHGTSPHRPSNSASRPHHRAVKSLGASRYSMPRSPRIPTSAAAAELAQVYPRSWNGTPRESQAKQADAINPTEQHDPAAASAEAASGGPGGLGDGQRTLQQLLARNEILVTMLEDSRKANDSLSVEMVHLKQLMDLQKADIEIREGDLQKQINDFEERRAAARKKWQLDSVMNTQSLHAASPPESKENIPTSPLRPPSTPESSRKIMALEAKLMAQREQLLLGEREEQQFIAKQLERLGQYEEATKALHCSLHDKDNQCHMLQSLHGDECERNAALMQQLRRVDANNVALSRRHEELEALLLKARLETCKLARDSEHNFQTEVRRHNEATVAAQQTAERLKEQIRQDEQTKQLQEKHLQEVTRQLASLKNAHQKMSEECMAAKNDCRDAEIAREACSLENVDLRTKLEEYTDRVAQVQQKCREAVEERDAATLISASLQGVQERLVAASKALAQLHFEHEGLKQKLIQKEIELNEITKQLEALKADKQALSSSLQKQVALTAQVSKERDDLTELLKALQAQLKAIDANMADLHFELARKEAAIQDKDASMQKLHAQLDCAQDQIHNQSIELLDKQDMVSELERSQHNLQRMIDSQAVQLEQVQEANEAKAADATETIANLQEKLAALSAELGKALQRGQQHASTLNLIKQVQDSFLLICQQLAYALHAKMGDMLGDVYHQLAQQKLVHLTTAGSEADDPEAHQLSAFSGDGLKIVERLKLTQEGLQLEYQLRLRKEQSEADLSAKLAALQLQLSATQGECDLLKRALSQLKARSKKMEQLQSDKETEQERLEEALDQTMEQMAALQAELEALQNKIGIDASTQTSDNMATSARDTSAARDATAARRRSLVAISAEIAHDITTGQTVTSTQPAPISASSAAPMGFASAMGLTRRGSNAGSLAASLSRGALSIGPDAAIQLEHKDSVASSNSDEMLDLGRAKISKLTRRGSSTGNLGSLPKMSVGPDLAGDIASAAGEGMTSPFAAISDTLKLPSAGMLTRRGSIAGSLMPGSPRMSVGPDMFPHAERYESLAGMSFEQHSDLGHVKSGRLTRRGSTAGNLALFQKTSVGLNLSAELSGHLSEPGNNQLAIPIPTAIDEPRHVSLTRRSSTAGIKALHFDVAPDTEAGQESTAANEAEGMSSTAATSPRLSHCTSANPPAPGLFRRGSNLGSMAANFSKMVVQHSMPFGDAAESSSSPSSLHRGPSGQRISQQGNTAGDLFSQTLFQTAVGLEAGAHNRSLDSETTLGRRPGKVVNLSSEAFGNQRSGGIDISSMGRLPSGATNSSQTSQDALSGDNSGALAHRLASGSSDLDPAEDLTRQNSSMQRAAKADLPGPCFQTSSSAKRVTISAQSETTAPAELTGRDSSLQHIPAAAEPELAPAAPASPSEQQGLGAIDASARSLSRGNTHNSFKSRLSFSYPTPARILIEPSATEANVTDVPAHISPPAVPFLQTAASSDVNKGVPISQLPTALMSISATGTASADLQNGDAEGGTANQYVMENPSAVAPDVHHPLRVLKGPKGQTSHGAAGWRAPTPEPAFYIAPGSSDMPNQSDAAGPWILSAEPPSGHESHVRPVPEPTESHRQRSPRMLHVSQEAAAAEPKEFSKLFIEGSGSALNIP
ncbi:hypothetical protein WJX74_010967 [Apatococcus lobatus]|uniref:Uncharacterized protein n=1 Tax=Apatococcus lobatus TaxID=904363 RepID=A0AAW1RYJ3_9CHLO